MKRKLIREQLGEDIYEYYPLGKYIVSAPCVCGGRPTFKHTRIEVAGVLSLLSAGCNPDQLVNSYNQKISREAIKEATLLAGKALVRQAQGATAHHADPCGEPDADRHPRTGGRRDMLQRASRRATAATCQTELGSF